MNDLEVPLQSQALFQSVGTDVNVNRPVLTGDVFEWVLVPILGNSPYVVAIVDHPCSMRSNGIDLADLVLVAPVVDHHESGVHVWKKHFKVHPVFGLPGFSKPVIKLEQSTLARSDHLFIENRIACASRSGINLLRQRLVHHLTRVIVETWKFDEEAAGTFEEIDLCEEWLDDAIGAGIDRRTALNEFHTWIRVDDGDLSRQARLGDPQRVQAVRQALRAELRKRYCPICQYVCCSVE